MTWFGSDFHFDHKLLWQKYRSQFETLQDMNNHIINCILEKVKPGDIIYFMGDLGWSMQSIRDFFNALPRNVQFHWVEGNHDHKFIKRAKKEFPRIHVWQTKTIKVEGQKIFLCHYPMTTWNCSHYNSWQIFGHHHSNKVDSHLHGKQMNVNLDHIGLNKVIISFDEVAEYMLKKPDNWDLLESDHTLGQKNE